MLPVEEVLPSLLEALEVGASAVLVAPPGAGKSTLAPLRFLDAPWLSGRKILMLEPRRLAARAVAALCLGHYELALRRHGQALAACRT